jgi:hypothetical protein
MPPQVALLPTLRFSQLLFLSTWLPLLRLPKRRGTTNVVFIASCVIVKVRSFDARRSTLIKQIHNHYGGQMTIF